MPLEKIISGGQSGVDRAALDAALSKKFPCSGWCPQGRLAEDGPIPARYPLLELAGGYRERTRQNVMASDATAVIYFSELEGGTKLTVAYCQRAAKPCKLIDGNDIAVSRASGELFEFIRSQAVRTLNVAGPRLSKSPEAYRYTFDLVLDLLANV